MGATIKARNDLYLQAKTENSDSAARQAPRTPNVGTRFAMQEAEEIIARRNARFTDAEQLFADLETNAGK